MSDLPEQVEFKGHLWTQRTRPLTIREDGWDGVPNLFRRALRLPLQLCVEWTVNLGPFTLAPGEKREFMFPFPFFPEDEP